MRQTLKQQRKAANMTQREVAKIIGISEIHYRMIEAGTREGKGHIWDKLQDFFGVGQRELREDMKEAVL